MIYGQLFSVGKESSSDAKSKTGEFFIVCEFFGSRPNAFVFLIFRRVDQMTLTEQYIVGGLGKTSVQFNK